MLLVAGGAGVSTENAVPGCAISRFPRSLSLRHRAQYAEPMHPRRLVAPLAAILVLLTVGCGPGDSDPAATPSDTPSATASATAAPEPEPADPAPPTSELVLTNTGLGPLVLGMNPADSAMIVAEPFACYDGGESFDNWVAAPSYADITTQRGDPGRPFIVGTIDGATVPAIIVLDMTIATESGLRIGSSLADVLAAPGTVEGETRDPWRRFLIPGEPGTIVIDVAAAADPTYWGTLQDTVTGLAVVDTSVLSIGAPGFHGVNPSPCT